MTLEIVDPANDPGDLEGLERELSEAVRSSKEPAGKQHDDKPAGTSDDNPESRIPEKYRGKSVEEIIAMHQNLESAYGRMANDLGQQRKLTDQLLELKRSDDLSRNTPVDDDDPKVEINVSELLENPTAALEKYYETRRQRDERAVLERLESMETTLARERFVSKHPDVQEIGNDPEFVEWLNSSPLRQRAAQQALNGDWQLADDLVTEFKSTRQQRQQKAPEPKKEVDEGVEAARKAALESGSNADASSKANGKIYRRADLIRLKLEKPHIYESEDFQREIMRAYAEGRVR